METAEVANLHVPFRGSVPMYSSDIFYIGDRSSAKLPRGDVIISEHLHLCDKYNWQADESIDLVGPTDKLKSPRSCRVGD